MKQKNEVLEKKNLVIKNVYLILKEVFRWNPMTKIQIPIYILGSIAKPYLSAMIISTAIAYVTLGDPGRFVLMITLILLANLLLDILLNLLRVRLDLSYQYTRVEQFHNKYVEKNLTTDYYNVEPPERLRLINKGANAIGTNWFGAYHLMQESVNAVIYIAGLFSYGAIIFVLDFRVALLMIGMLICDVLFRNHAIKYSDQHREENTEIYRERNYLKRSTLDIRAGKDVRVYEMEGWFHNVYEQLIHAAHKYQRGVQLRWLFPTISDECWKAPRNLVVYAVLITKVLSGELTIATCVLYIGLINGFSNWIYGISLNFSVLSQSSHEFNDFLAVMQTKNRFLHEEGAHFEDLSKVKIEFRDVSFHYEEGKEVLSHVSFTIQPGEKLALVGNNGAGKTTIVKLLCGLYQPTEGAIYINDHDINTMNLDEYQGAVSVLFQDTNPLSFTIAMNVAGCDEEEIDYIKVRESLKQAGLWEKVERLEQKEHTYLTQVLDEHGILLSGGELQKLLLARAIYKNGSLLILDEPTAALDPLAESKMYEEYNSMTQEKTSLFISHRLASTKFCDRILFLEEGRVMESGSHKELIELGGKYKEIFDVQSHYYQDKVVLADGE